MSSSIVIVIAFNVITILYLLLVTSLGFKMIFRKFKEVGSLMLAIKSEWLSGLMILTGLPCIVLIILCIYSVLNR